MTAGRSPSSRSPPPRPSTSSPAIRPTCSCSRSASAAGSTPPTSSPTPLATVITAGLDRPREVPRRHASTAIAAEKAGILKRGRPAIVAPQAAEALAGDRGQRRARAARRCSSPTATGSPMPSAAGWSIRTRTASSTCRARAWPAATSSPMPARPSPRSAAPGSACRRRRSRRASPTVEWPARLQRLTAGALVDRAPADAEIWLDGGHNPGAGVVIAEAMADLEERAPRPLYLIAGMLNTKDPVGFFRPFAGLVRRVYTVPVPLVAGRPRPGRTRRRSPPRSGLPTEPSDSVAEALDRIAARGDRRSGRRAS